MKINKNIVLYGAFALASLSSAGLRAAQASQDGFRIGLSAVDGELQGADIVELRQEIIEDTVQLDQVKEKLRALEHENRALRQNLEEQDGAIQGMAQESTELTKRFEATRVQLEKENASLKAHLKHLETRIEEAEKLVTEKQSLLDAQRLAMVKHTAENARIPDLEGAVALATEGREKAASHVIKLEATLHTQSAELATVRTLLERAQVTAAAQTSAIDGLKVQLAQAERDNKDLLNSSVHVSDTHASDEGNSLLVELEAAAPQIEIADLRKKVQVSQQAMDEKIALFTQLQSELQALRQAHSTCGGTVSEVTALKVLVQQKEEEIGRLDERLKLSEGAVSCQADATARLEGELAAVRTSNAVQVGTLHKAREQKETELARLSAQAQASQTSATAQVARLEADLGTAREALRKAEASKALEITALQAAVQAKQAELARLSVQVQASQTSATAQVARLEADLGTAREALRKAETSKVSDSAALQAAVEGKQAEIARLSAQVQALQASATTQTAQKVAQAAKFESDLAAVREALRKAEASKVSEIAALQAAVEAKKAEITRLSAQAQAHQASLEVELLRAREEMDKGRGAAERAAAAAATALQQERAISARTIGELQTELNQGEELRVDMLGQMDGQRAKLQKEIDTLKAQIGQLERQIAAEQARVRAQDRDIAAFRLREQEVVQLKALRDRVGAIAMHGNFEAQVVDLERNFTARMTLMRSQADERRAERDTHVKSSASSIVGKAFGAMAYFGTAASEAGAAGTVVVGGVAAAGMAFENRAQRLHREKKERLDSEIEALELEVVAHQLCIDIIKIAVDIRNQIHAAQRT